MAEIEHSEVDNSQRHPKVFASVQTKDSCFLLRDNSFAFVRQENAARTFACEILHQRHTKPLFHQPCSSGLLNIVCIGNGQVRMKKCTTARKGSVPEGGLPPTGNWWFCPHTPHTPSTWSGTHILRLNFLILLARFRQLDSIKDHHN